MARKRKVDLTKLGTQEHYLDAELYDHEYRRRRQDIEYYLALARGELSPGTEILELCCGSGRLTRKLCHSGFNVVGMDLSAPMLERAKYRISTLPKRCRDNASFFRADVRRFSLGRRFPMILMAFNSFEHLYTRGDIEACLAMVRDHLEPDGLFAFDVQLPDLRWLLKDPGKRWAKTRFKHPVTGQRLLYSTNHIYDHATQVAHIRLYYEPLDEGPVEQEFSVHLSQRKFYPAELEAYLHYAGFQVLRHHGDFHGGDLDEYTESQVLLCRLRPDSA